MKKRAIALLLTLSLILCFVSCDNPEPTSTPTNAPIPTPAPTETPWALYKTMNVGSSKTLQGTCLFINIFLADGESSFTEMDKQIHIYTIHPVVKFLYAQAEKYNVPLSIIYDTEDTIIDYTVDYIIPRGLSAEYWRYSEIIEIIEEIRLQYDIDALMEKYDADNLSFIININKSGHCYAYSCEEKKNVEFDEVSIIYNYNGIPDGMPENEISSAGNYSYAHEILHLFGAIDLYNLDKERLTLAKQYFPRDIMVTGSPLLKDLSIDALTAYLIGWTEELDEKYEIFLN